MKVKNIYYWLLLVCMCVACNDPYEGDTYSIYDVQPASTYLSSRSDDFSEWVKIMKYADLYNATNQATQYYTLFVPNNQAVTAFYQKKGVSSIEELGAEYADALVKFHTVADTIDTQTLIAKDGNLEKKTVSDDFLSVSFGRDGNEASGLNAIYLNKEAHVVEFANKVSNGYVYMLDAVMSPLVESLYARLSESGRPFNLFKEALDVTGWGDSIDVIYKEVAGSGGTVSQRKQEFTVLAVSDAVYKSQGIESLADLAAKVEAQSNDYKSLSNKLNQYVAYHLLEGAYDLAKMQTFDTDADKSKMWGTLYSDGILRISKEDDDAYYLNYADEEARCQFMEDDSNLAAKNGYIHQISGYMPVVEPQPEVVLYDPTNSSTVKNYLESNGFEGKYQTVHDKTEYGFELKDCGIFEYSLQKPGGTVSSYGNLRYQTSKKTNDWKDAQYGDLLILNLGYNGWVSMTTPALVKGKYKLTIQFGHAKSLDFVRKRTTTSNGSGSNGGRMLIDIDGQQVDITPYPSATSDGSILFSFEAFGEDNPLVFDASSAHTLKVTIKDPAATGQSKYRLYIDYFKFEPILEETEE